ncbi:MAG: hypothetical protein PHQ22_10810 [Sulfuricurvum sp.]|nr:hypothetical protein [Sulfuricurvum sp.]
MITKEEILKLTWRDTVLQIIPAEQGILSGTLHKPRVWRVNGACKLWKRSPERFRLPIKRGLYEHGYITEENAHLFALNEG